MCMQYITAFSMFFCLFGFFVNKMLFIMRVYIITKLQVHFLSFIDKTMHQSLDCVCGFSRVSQCSHNITHGFSGTSVYQIKYTVVSAYNGAFFLNSNGVVSSTRTMLYHKVHVSTKKGCSSCGVVIFSSIIGNDVKGYPVCTR